MKRLASRNAETARKAFESIQGATIRFYPEEEFCQTCGLRLQVRKTRTRSLVTLQYGSIQAHETVLSCPHGCRSPNGKLRLYRSEFLARLVAPRHTYGFDVVAKIGVLRFLECRQRLEIQEELRNSYGLSIPEGTIEELIDHFLDLIRALHDVNVPELRKNLEASGGYVLHVDGTCEEGSQVHFACLAGPEPVVLWSEKIESENAVEIRGVLKEVEKRFSKPAAVVEDLSAAIRNAVSGQWPGLPMFYYHQHFLRDVGKDLLGECYNRLRELLRQSEIRGQLRQYLKTLDRELGERKDEARRIFQQIEDPNFLKGKERSLKATSVGGGLAEWILSASAEGGGRGFPFDIPHLSFYLRASHAVDVLDQRVLPHITGRTPRGEKLLLRLRGILHAFLNSVDLEPTARELQELNAVFLRLRQTLRLAAEGSSKGINEGTCYSSPKEVKEAEDALSKLREQLRHELELDLSRSRRKSIQIVLKHLDKYWDGLFGHSLPLQDEQRYLMVQRTNNIIERFFRHVKRFARRVSGKKRLNREVDALPGHALLVFNLKTVEYVKLVCGSLDRLPEAFAQLAHDGNIPSPAGTRSAATILDRKTRRRPDFPAKITAAFALAK